jgi:nucleoside-diphosphate-sugar epimerase
MRVFITGATGYIGQAVVPALVEAGHEVVGLSRSAEKDNALVKLGAEPVRGSLSEPESYRAEAAQCEVIIHAAFDYQAEGAAKDLSAVDTLLAAAKQGGAKSFIFTSGVWVLGSCPDGADEHHATHPFPTVKWRVDHEQRVLAARTADLATAVLRPGIVYGGKSSLLNPLFESAERDGAATYVGDGKNRWPLIYRDDLAQLYRLIIETQADGLFHGVDGSSLAVAEVARLAGLAAGKGGETKSLPLEVAKKERGAWVEALVLDQVVIAPRSRELGWQPRFASFAQGSVPAYSEWKA